MLEVESCVAWQVHRIKKTGMFQKGETSFRDKVFMCSEPALDLTFGCLHFLAGFFLGELVVCGLVGEVVTEGHFYVAFWSMMAELRFLSILHMISLGCHMSIDMPFGGAVDWMGPISVKRDSGEQLRNC